jgi:hypothetical protein
MLGSYAVFFGHSEDISEGEIIVTFAGFAAAFAGLVGLMILFFRPVAFGRREAARWEMTRIEGKSKFIGRFLLASLPLLLAVLLPVALSETFESFTVSILKISVVSVIMLAIMTAVGFELWKHFEGQHSVTTGKVDTDAVNGQYSTNNHER